MLGLDLFEPFDLLGTGEFVEAGGLGDFGDGFGVFSPKHLLDLSRVSS